MDVNPSPTPWRVWSSSGFWSLHLTGRWALSPSVIPNDIHPCQRKSSLSANGPGYSGSIPPFTPVQHPVAWGRGSLRGIYWQGLLHVFDG